MATEEMADEPPELTGSVLWNCRTYLFAAREVFARFVAICRLASVLHAASPRGRRAAFILPARDI